MSGSSSGFVAAAAIGALTAFQAASAAPLFDDFDGPAGPPDAATWVTSTTAGASASMTVDGASNLVVDVGIPNGSQRAIVVTQASDFDAFAAPLTVHLDGIALGGSLGTGVFNSGFLVYGRSTNNAASGYFANGGVMAYGVAVSVQNTAGGYRLHLNEFSDNDTDSNPADGTVLYRDLGLAGAPTALTVVIDGANRSLGIGVAGTTFTADGSASATQALSEHFTAANMTVGDALLARLSVGAINGGTVETGTTFTIDSISAAVPEPATVGLLASAGLLLATRRRR
jgi:hypothetical protein